MRFNRYALIEQNFNEEQIGLILVSPDGMNKANYLIQNLELLVKLGFEQTSLCFLSSHFQNSLDFQLFFPYCERLYIYEMPGLSIYNTNPVYLILMNTLIDLGRRQQSVFYPAKSN